MNINYRKNRNTKKAAVFTLFSLLISALSTVFIFLGASPLILAPPSAFFFALSLDALYKYILTDLIYSVRETPAGFLFTIHRAGAKSSSKIFECFISDKTEICKYEKRTKGKNGKKDLLSFRSELFSRDLYLLTLFENEREYDLIITVDSSFAGKIGKIVEFLSKD